MTNRRVRMSARTVQLLHVEDDKLQQVLMAKLLGSLTEYAFTITCAKSEDEAITVFQRGETECVILDYQLSQGNGLSCLRRLRQLDAIVPIVTVSGMATADIAADLLGAGADDYIEKKALGAETLSQSLRQALVRADAWRRHAPDTTTAQMTPLLEQLCSTARDRFDTSFLGQLDTLEAAARNAGLSAVQLQRQFDTVCSRIDGLRAEGSFSVKLLLRPFLLEILYRLSGSPASEDHKAFAPTRRLQHLA
jgi:CheY-like chemotaxis protein